MESQELLQSMKRLDDTGHTPRLFQELDSAGLVAPIKEEWAKIKGGKDHPVLPFRNVVQALSACGKLESLLGEKFGLLDGLVNFWERYRPHQPNHPIYSLDKECLGSTVPLLAHADEGTGKKKKAIMILQIQPLPGKGTSRNAEGGLNFVGVSVSTRYLYSVMTAKVYAGVNAKRLDSLVGHMADDLAGLFHSPVEVTIKGTKKLLFFSCLGLKGDWPALVKLGKLQRHFGRTITSAGAESTGICHLCRAGQDGFSYNNFDYDTMLESRRLVEPPWSSPGALTTKIPQDQTRLAQFFKIDLFHTFHKGIFGDLAANAIEPRLMSRVCCTLLTLLSC